MKLNRAAVAAIVGFGLMVGLVTPASAGKPEMQRDHVVFTAFDQDICGLNLDVVVDVRFVDRLFFDADGNFDHFLGTSSGSNEFINDAGESVLVTFANVAREVDVSIDEEANTITILVSNRGLPEKISTPHGPVITRDAGLITFLITIDLATETTISQETILSHGPHPQADSDFALFCDIITAELG